MNAIVRPEWDQRDHSPAARQDVFFKYYKWRLWSKDLDHTHYLTTIAKNVDKDDFEKRAWMAMLFGTCYRVPQVHAFIETFPDFHAINWDTLEQWTNDNYTRCTYGTDTRYNKGKFYKQALSIKNDWLKGRTFKQAINEVVKTDRSDEENFWGLMNSVWQVNYFGRMTGWLALQAMSDLLDLPIQIKDIFIADPRADGSMGSIWNGLSYFRGRDDLVIHKHQPNNITENDVAEGREILMDLKARAEAFAGRKICCYQHESIMCQYKRLWLPEYSKEAPGHASGDATSRYLDYRKNWPEIDWAPMREAYRTQPGIIAGLTSHGALDGAFSKHGVLMNMDEMFPELPNSWRTVGIDPNSLVVKEIWTDDGLTVPVKPY